MENEIEEKEIEVCTVAAKKRIRERLQKDVENYLASGNQIEIIPEETAEQVIGKMKTTEAFKDWTKALKRNETGKQDQCWNRNDKFQNSFYKGN